MRALKKFLFRQAERRLKKLPAIERGAARFALHYPGKYVYGRGSYGLPLVHDWNEGSTLRIGAFCSIASNVQIFLGGHHHVEWASTYPFPAMFSGLEHIRDYGFTRGDVVIGNDVWLCSDCLILSGVTIGHGAVVAAGAVVAEDVEPYSVVAGNPARPLKWRFEEPVRRALLQMAWWDWPQAEIEQIAPLLCSPRLDELIAYAERRKEGE